MYGLANGAIRMWLLNSKLSLEQAIFIAYFKEHNGEVGYNFKQIYGSLPNNVKIALPQKPFSHTESIKVPKEWEEKIEEQKAKWFGRKSSLKLLNNIMQHHQNDLNKK